MSATEGTGGRAVAVPAAPVDTVPDHLTDALEGLSVTDVPPADVQPETPPKRRGRSGTSGAERARRNKARGAAPADKAPRAPRSSARVNIKTGMTQLYTMLGAAGVTVGAVSGSPLPSAVGLATTSQASACAAAWDQLAKKNPRVRAALEQMLTVSSVGVLLAAHAPILLSAGVGAGVVPLDAGMALGVPAEVGMVLPGAQHGAPAAPTS